MKKIVYLFLVAFFSSHTWSIQVPSSATLESLLRADVYENEAQDLLKNLFFPIQGKDLSAQQIAQAILDYYKNTPYKNYNSKLNYTFPKVFVVRNENMPVINAFELAIRVFSDTKLSLIDQPSLNVVQEIINLTKNEKFYSDFKLFTSKGYGQAAFDYDINNIVYERVLQYFGEATAYEFRFTTKALSTISYLLIQRYIWSRIVFSTNSSFAELSFSIYKDLLTIKIKRLITTSTSYSISLLGIINNLDKKSPAK